MKYIDKYRWEEGEYGSLKAYALEYGEDIETVEDLIKFVEDEDGEDLEETGGEDKISAQEAFDSLMAARSAVSGGLKDKLKKIAEDLEALQAEAQTHGLNVKDFGDDLLNAIDDCGWSSSSLSC